MPNTLMQLLKKLQSKKFLKDISGATAVEYVLICGAMAVVLLAAMPIIAEVINTKFSSIGMHISAGK